MNETIHEIVAEAVRRQPWYQKNANTIVAALGALAAILSFVLTLSLGLPENVIAAVGAAIPVLTALAVKLTRNGVQASTADKLLALGANPVLDAERERSGYVGVHRLEEAR